MLRITSGTAKNKKLEIPEIPAFRGVQEKVKLAMFAILGNKIVGSTCLDLYAGSGNLGIEALSRGAEWCDFVDEDKKAQTAIKKNLNNCDFLEKAEVFHEDSVKFASNTPQKYDVVFVDPFYFDTKHKFLLQNLGEILNTEGTIFFTHGKDFDIEEALENTSLKLKTQRRYGKSYLSVLYK